MWADVDAKKLSFGWGVMAKIYKDICLKKVADTFVWIICSRDLSGIAAEDLERICWSKAQCKYNAHHPYSDRNYLMVFDDYLEKLTMVRQFSVLKEEIATKGDFPSTYHFRICDFSKSP